MDKKNPNTKKIIELSVAAALLLAWIIISAISLSINELLPFSLLCILTFVAIVLYAAFGYKKAHSNFLRYVYILFALSIGGSSIYLNTVYPSLSCYFTLVAVVGIAFMSGRLDRYKQNAYITIGVAWLLIFAFIANYKILQTGDAVLILLSLTHIVQWIILSVFYFIRFEAHKAAGAENK